jgi:hypothetical protein
VRLVRIDASANTITLDPNGSETVDGRTTARLISRYDAATVCKQGSNFVTRDARWSPRQVYFRTPGAYSFTVADHVPLGCNRYRAVGTGAGGGGAGSNLTTGQRLGGGGGAARGNKWIATTLDTAITGSVGTGGAAKAAVAGGVAGNNGGNTTVTGSNLGTLTAGGGQGGPVSTAGGLGGVCTGAWDEAYDGESGPPTSHSTNQVGLGGNAGGGGGVGGKSNVSEAGHAPGGGGAGSNHVASNSGKGADGEVAFYM